MEININKLTAPQIISNLHRKYYSQNPGFGSEFSSHWRDCSSKISVDIDNDGKITSFKGYGFGDLDNTHIVNKMLKYLCNLSYFVKLPHKKDLIFVMKKAVPNLKAINSYLSYDCFRQICSLCLIRRHLKVKEGESFDILVIGDGYGFLSSLLKSLYPGSRITLVDIGKVLLFQAVNLQIIHSRCRHLSIEEDNPSNKDYDFLYVPAEFLDKTKNMRYQLSINIASMQEMNYATIERYFDFLRTNSRSDNLFYCCNREIKTLCGGERIEFSKYPWQNGDSHLVNEICPFYSYYFSYRFPFIHRFDGIFLHRLTNLKINGHLY